MRAQRAPSEEPDEPELDVEPELGAESTVAPRPRSRWVHAWRVLRGQEVTPHQVAAEWLEYKLIFNDILTRLGAQLARAAKVEHKRLKKQLAPAPELASSAAEHELRPLMTHDRKSELRRKAATMRGIIHPRSQPVTNGEDAP